MSMFFVELLVGICFTLLDLKKQSNSYPRSNSRTVIKFRTGKKSINSNDRTKKVLFLLFSAAFFELYDCIVRRYFF